MTDSILNIYILKIITHITVSDHEIEEKYNKFYFQLQMFHV